MQLNDILFIDIETVGGSDFIINGESLFEKRHKKQLLLIEEDNKSDFFEKHAGLEAEFGKIVCISMGRVSGQTLFIKSFVSDDEKELLSMFRVTVDEGTHLALGGHNILEYDIPFIFRRCLINAMKIPKGIDLRGVKTWDIKHVDTMKQWANGAWNYKISLELLCTILGLESSKSTITGADVSGLFFGNDPDRLTKIKTYCEGDVISNVQAYCRMNEIPVFNELQIEIR